MKKKLITGVLLCMLGLLAGCGDKTSARIIKATDMQGVVRYTRDAKENTVYFNMNFEPKDEVETGKESYLLMQLDEDKYVYMYADSRVVMDCAGDAKDSKTNIRLESGEIYNEIKNPLSEDSWYEVETSNATIGVRGTQFFVTCTDEKTLVYCADGIVEVEADNNVLQLEPTQAAVVEDDEARYAELNEIEGEMNLGHPAILNMVHKNPDATNPNVIKPDEPDREKPGDAASPEDMPLQPIGQDETSDDSKTQLTEENEDIWGPDLLSADPWVYQKKNDTIEERYIENEDLETGIRSVICEGTSNGVDIKIIMYYNDFKIEKIDRLENGVIRRYTLFEHDGEKYVCANHYDEEGLAETFEYADYAEDGFPIKILPTVIRR